MPLTDTAVRQAKPREKDYSLTDADGLSLFVSVKGTKAWHFRFSWEGKQPRISLGTYPELSLKDARVRRDECRAKVANGIDPRGNHRPDSKVAPVPSFKDVSDEWHAFKTGRWADDSRQGSGAQSRRVLDSDILPFVGSTPFADVHRRDLVAVVGRIEARGALNMPRRRGVGCGRSAATVSPRGCARTIRRLTWTFSQSRHRRCGTTQSCRTRATTCPNCWLDCVATAGARSRRMLSG